MPPPTINKPITHADMNAAIVNQLEIAVRVTPKLVKEKKKTQEEIDKLIESLRAAARYHNTPAIEKRKERTAALITEAVKAGRVNDEEVRELARQIVEA